MLGGDVEAVALKFIRAQNRSKAVELGGILSDPMVDSLSASDWHGVIPISLEWVDGPVTLSTVKNAFACVTYEDASPPLETK